MGSNRQTKKPANRQTTGSSESRVDDLAGKRERFEESGRFPLRKVVIGVSVVVVIALLGAAGWSKVQASKQVSSGVQVASQTADSVASSSSGSSSGGTVSMAPVALNVSGADASFALADVQKATLAGMKYTRKTPLAGDWQNITGGNDPSHLVRRPQRQPGSGHLLLRAVQEHELPHRREHPGLRYLLHQVGSEHAQGCLRRLHGLSASGNQGQQQGGNIVVATADLESWTPRQ